MELLLILPVLAAGFLACHIHPEHYYKLHRYDGQYLYLKCAQMGMLCLLIGLALCYLGQKYIPETITICSFSFQTNIATKISNAFHAAGATKEKSTSNALAWMLLINLASFLSAYIICLFARLRLLIKYRRWDCRVLITAKLLADSPIDNLLFRLSLQKNKLAMLTLDNRKVYIGKIVSMGEPNETSGIDKDINIMPVISGYRSTETMRFFPISFYEEKEAQITIALRQDKIISASEFDIEHFKRIVSK